MNDLLPYAPGGYTPEAEAKRIEEVQATGDVIIVFGLEDRLLLDLDTEAQWNYFSQTYKTLLARFDGVRAACWWYSKSSTQWSRRHHVVIQMTHTFPAAHRLILQAALGSDPKRELFGSLRLENGVLEPSLLFRPKGAELHQVGDLPLLNLDPPRPDQFQLSEV